LLLFLEKEEYHSFPAENWIGFGRFFVWRMCGGVCGDDLGGSQNVATDTATGCATPFFVWRMCGGVYRQRIFCEAEQTLFASFSGKRRKLLNV
jgi:hypothetical protein